MYPRVPMSSSPRVTVLPSPVPRVPCVAVSPCGRVALMPSPVPRVARVALWPRRLDAVPRPPSPVPRPPCRRRVAQWCRPLSVAVCCLAVVVLAQDKPAVGKPVKPLARPPPIKPLPRPPPVKPLPRPPRFRICCE